MRRGVFGCARARAGTDTPRHDSVPETRGLEGNGALHARHFALERALLHIRLGCSIQGGFPFFNDFQKFK